MNQVYKVWTGHLGELVEIQSSEIEKETPKQIILKQCLPAFDFHTYLKPPLARSREEAVTEFIAAKEAKITALEAEMRRLRNQINQAKAL